jgi:hypothetical protein
MCVTKERTSANARLIAVFAPTSGSVEDTESLFSITFPSEDFDNHQELSWKERKDQGGHACDFKYQPASEFNARERLAHSKIDTTPEVIVDALIDGAFSSSLRFGVHMLNVLVKLAVYVDERAHVQSGHPLASHLGINLDRTYASLMKASQSPE